MVYGKVHQMLHLAFMLRILDNVLLPFVTLTSNGFWSLVKQCSLSFVSLQPVTLLFTIFSLSGMC